MISRITCSVKVYKLKLADVYFLVLITWYQDLFKRNFLTPNSDMERIKPPSELDIDGPNLADVWKEWKEAWELYRISSDLHEKDDTIQSNYPKYSRDQSKTSAQNPTKHSRRCHGKDC